MPSESQTIKAIVEALRQLDVSDEYAKEENKDPKLQNTWQIQNGHMREYITGIATAFGKDLDAILECNKAALNRMAPSPEE